MQFRGYETDDFEAMFRLDEVCFDPRFRFSRRTMQRFAESAKARVVVAEEGHGLAGFCIAHLEKVHGTNVGYVVTLDVAQAWRRQGLAADLMRRVEAQMAEAGCVGMMLHVFDGNAAAVRLYERLGYERVRKEEGFYGADSRGQMLDALVYLKLFPESGSL